MTINDIIIDLWQKKKTTRKDDVCLRDPRRIIYLSLSGLRLSLLELYLIFVILSVHGFKKPYIGLTTQLSRFTTQGK